eukprot:579005-Rhodomonas_salina.1
MRRGTDSLASAHPVDVAEKGVDLAVVSEVAERLRTTRRQRRTAQQECNRIEPGQGASAAWCWSRSGDGRSRTVTCTSRW